MSTRVADRVDDWNQRQFSGGHGGLADLAAEEFSGVVRAGGAELYMTTGTVVAIRRGSMEDFEDGSGTAFEAPDPSMPLLAAMQAEDVDPRAEYYSEETPIAEVDRTLSDGGFTGYIELSENVLSGDYFVVYHGGTSSSVAFVGASGQLVTGDEAFETADDEVGIYHVHQVDVEPIEIPESAAATAAAGGESAGEAEAEEEDDSAESADSADEMDEADESAEDAEDSTTAASEATEAAEADEPPDESTEADGVDADESDAEATAAEGDPGNSTNAGTASGAGGAAGSDAGGPASQAQSGGGSGAAGQATADRSHGTGTAGGATAGSAGQAGDLETRGVPSLDPDLTQYPQRSTGGRSAPSGGAPAEAREAPSGGQGPQGAAGGAAQQAGGQRSAGGRGGGQPAEAAREAAGTRSAETASGDLAALEDELAAREAELDELEAELEAARSEREETEAELADVREERDELETEATRLREELQRLEEELGAATDAERRMTPTEAIEGTNLFVDYESKGQGTLEKAHGGSETRDDVNANLQLGVHTEFDERSVAVGGQDFGEFLRGTLQYRFAEWLLGQLLFEIRDTGHAEALTDLYDALPEIRRVEFNGEIDAEYVEDGQEKVATERFDVIFRHRMGDPLVVANLNDARDPATGGMMTSLVTAAERVGQTEDSLAAAFLVTSSFFESEALETVAEATKGGILSRDKRTSFVNLSRKSGYHLCLVAAREGNFHMEVPEL